jgi:hypothetical protein
MHTEPNVERPATVEKRSRRVAIPDEFLDGSERRALARVKRASEIRRSSGRRRLIDPATCEREYSAEELEFMQAMYAYTRTNGRRFPTWGEVLEVCQGLGYRKAQVVPSA